MLRLLSFSFSSLFIQSLAYEFQAEVAMRADGKPGMSDEEVCLFFRASAVTRESWIPLFPNIT